MSVAPAPIGAGRRRRRRGLAAIALAAALALGALALAGALPGSGASERAAALPSAEMLAQTDASVPARQVTMIGATPEEAGAPGPNETWGVGLEGAKTVVVRYSGASGWTLGGALPNGFRAEDSPLTGAMTPRGAGVLAGTVPEEGAGPRQVLLVRSPGGAFSETARITKGKNEAEGGEALLGEHEELFGTHRAPLIAALDEEGGSAGALIAPAVLGEGVEHQVLHWDGHEWTSEPIAIPTPSAESFRVLALAASSPHNAWLLAQLASSGSYPAGAVALFRRVEEAGHWSWKPVALSPGSGDGEAHPLTLVDEHGASAPFTVANTGNPPSVQAQLLTVTSAGVWVDGERADIHARTPDSATLFFKPEGAGGGKIEGSWCVPPPEGGAACQLELPHALPIGSGRSLAWDDGSRFGQRVITGLSGGELMTLHGEVFATVLSLGAGASAEEVPGGRFGAAFSSATEGWLGMGGLPIHMTRSLAPSKLKPWPVPFRHPLLAIAPAPGQPIGALSSEALAVGDRGAVARYKPGQGWVPESLFGPGGRVETPRLRAVAWPTPMRAFAVGDQGEMWLWRGETGLWEHDPAEPLNFRGDLLGVAFDPSNPQRGYAVGSTGVGLGGVLLRYGKSWIQETELPAEAQHAVFIGIAFAGSQAIVAYRSQPNPHEQRFVGGLLLNDGSGWRVDQEATGLMGSAQPEALAGLPDGGAAFETTGPEGPRVYERESAGSPWVATPTPLPGQSAGSLSLFREAGALRAIVSGGGGVTNQSEGQSPPPGAPPNLPPILEPVAGQESGGLLRQTASGWNDEGHELNLVGKPAGGYQEQDLPYRPDSIFDVLIDPSGTQGWAVGGFLEAEEHVETGDVERYPADGVKPTGEGSEEVCVDGEASKGSRTVPATSSCGEETAAERAESGARDVTFAFGGGAECVAPCSERANAGIGPLAWLSKAVALAGGIPGVQSFIYTGPSVSAGTVSGPRSVSIPFASELETNASILDSGASLPVYMAAAPQDLDARPEREGTEATLESVLKAFNPGQVEHQSSEVEAGCASTVGCQAAYFSFNDAGVQVIVLDDTGDVDNAQLGWLVGQLGAAESSGTPAIVVGAADLSAQKDAGDRRAEEVIEVLVRDGASAYFYDSPNEDAKKPLTVGGESIESYGSGTLGYGDISNERFGNFHGASGILLGEVEVKKYDPVSHRAPVLARLIPVIDELAIEAKSGVLLRRSQAAMFAGLARRPRAGSSSGLTFPEQRVDPYVPIPSICSPECPTGLLPEYTFTSSDTSIGDFVEPNLATPEPHPPLQGPDGKPIHDAHSGLFCAYNPGPTTVTVEAGGLKSSLLVNVQPGSVREPCGTVPAKRTLASHSQNATAPPPPPPPQPAPQGTAPTSSLALPPPAVPLATPVPPALPHPGVLPAFVPLAALPAPLIPFVPPPVPTPARPTPPSGTSAVTSPIEAAEKEEEEEEAPESVSNKAVAYQPAEHEPVPLYLLGVVVLAAFAGASIRRRPRGRREIEVARATVSSARRQRRTGREWPR